MANLTCIVPKCTSSSNNNDLKFHLIPCDSERRKKWLTAFKRTDLINQSPRVLKDKFVCSLHFNKSLYRYENLNHSATLSLRFTDCVRDSFTQTWESVKLTEPGEPSEVKTELPDLIKMEVTTSYTQTEEFNFIANSNLEVKKENDNTDIQFDEHNMQCNEPETKTEEFNFNANSNLDVKKENYNTDIQFDEHNMQCNEPETKTESKIKEDYTELSDGEKEREEMEQTSSDSNQDSDDESSEMSIEEFLRLNEGLEEQIRKELNKKNIPQTPIQVHKGVQTDDVTVFDIPKNNKCFQQCLRCGKNKNRLKPLLKPDHRITLEEFESACERFLSPTFCATVKTQIMLDKLQDKNTDEKTKKKMMSFFGVSLSN